MRSQAVHISPNTLQGSLQDVSVSRLLDSCKKSLVTGRIDVDTGFVTGWIELRAGMVEAAEYGNLHGGAALTRLRDLNDGSYELSQRLPGLDGKLGSAASFRGELRDVSLVELMRHCEDNALTCTIVIIHEFDRGEVEYRGGEIARVALNGVTDEDRIVDMVRLEDARFMVSAPPLDVGVDGWPVVRGDPTAPFRVEHLAARPPARTSQHAAAAGANRPLPGAPPPLPGAPPPRSSAPPPLPEPSQSPQPPPPAPLPPPPPARAKFRENLDRPVPAALEFSGVLGDDDGSAPEGADDAGFLEDVFEARTEPRTEPHRARSPALSLVPLDAGVTWVARPKPNPYSDFRPGGKERAARQTAPRQPRHRGWLRRLIDRLLDRLPI